MNNNNNLLDSLGRRETQKRPQGSPKVVLLKFYRKKHPRNKPRASNKPSSNKTRSHQLASSSTSFLPSSCHQKEPLRKLRLLKIRRVEQQFIYFNILLKKGKEDSYYFS